MDDPNLVITIRGDSSEPLANIARALQEWLSKQDFKKIKIVDHAPDSQQGWDGLNCVESVEIRIEAPLKRHVKMHKGDVRAQQCARGQNQDVKLVKKLGMRPK